MDANANKKAAFILFGIAAAEGTWMWANLRIGADRFWRYTGFYDTEKIGIFGWLLALLIAAAFISSARRLPSVRENLIRISWLKLLAIAVAITAGFCEESIFRKLLMDSLQRHQINLALQILASGLAFGLIHAVWGLMRFSLGAAFRATIATGSLGIALAIVYVVSHRNVAPCIVSHLLINLFLEPGLVLAAVRGEMSAGSTSAAAV